jgi:formylglycine-generating enzyme required for sulfatase activity
MESELFGHEKGAFTGAVGSKPGRFELADGGTLFLDEIAEIPPEMQVKLLRVLQESEFERVGGVRTIRVDVRLVAATNRDLKAEIDKGTFREDLFYRLNVVPIGLAPLRERRDDIPGLVDFFVKRFNERLGKSIAGVEPEALDKLNAYRWPGNIRELENIVERAVLFADGSSITIDDLPPEVSGAASGTPSAPPVLSANALEGEGLKEQVKAATSRLERELIARALSTAIGGRRRSSRRDGVAPAIWTASLWLASGAIGGCRCDASTDGAPSTTASVPSWDVEAQPDPARPGMVWIPAGTLLAGTKPGQLPRIADQELPGTPVELEGFFIDEFNYPAEPGAIPRTGMTQAEARAICEDQDKRLCTELEWERACKGPENTTYEYGDVYDASICSTGNTDALAPNGVNTRCRSKFDVADMHGSAFNWTSSPWARGAELDDDRVAVRGGNGEDGELIGRCAHARAMAPGDGDPRVGLRCCAGSVNPARVKLSVERGNELAYRPFDPRIARKLEELVPDEIRDAVSGRPEADQFRVERLWMWRPIGNEELVIGGGCAHPPVHDDCGVIVARLTDEADLVAFVSSDWWIPTVGEHQDPRTLYVYGGDIGGAFRKPMIYAWGRIREGDKYRKKRGGWTSSPQ